MKSDFLTSFSSLQRPNSSTKSRHKPYEFSSLLFTVTSIQLFCIEIYISSKSHKPLTVSTVQLLYTVKEKKGKPDRKPYPLSYGLGNPYRNLKSENSQDYCMPRNLNEIVR